MKKIISLLLVLVMTLGLLSGIALADDPAVTEPIECAAADAVVKATCSDDASAVYYFDTLDQNVLAWVCLNMAGEKTITLLKDLELTGVLPEGNYILKIPNDQGSWNGRSGDKYPLTIDLGGKTLSYTGAGTLFYIERYGFTLENGTVLYKGESADAAFIALSTPHFRTAFTNGNTVWTPDVNLKDVTVYVAGGAAIVNYEYSPVITIEDSTVWNANGPVIDLKKTAQDGMGEDAVPYTGDYIPEITIEQSTVGSGTDSVLTAAEAGATVTVMDSILVSASGALAPEGTEVDLDDKGQETAQDDAWTSTIAGTAVSGKAVKYGEAAAVALPFTDIQDTDWYYEFVAEMYEKGVINGMTETTFVPNGTLTYGQALKLIAVGLGKGEQPAGDHWASGYLTLAKTEGWLSADVDLNGSVSRLSFCQIAAKAKGLTEQPAVNPFADTADTSVLALVNAGVINGMTATSFMPDGLLTRAQIAKIISLLVKL